MTARQHVLTRTFPDGRAPDAWQAEPPDSRTEGLPAMTRERYVTLRDSHPMCVDTAEHQTIYAFTVLRLADRPAEGFHLAFHTPSATVYLPPWFVAPENASGYWRTTGQVCGMSDQGTRITDIPAGTVLAESNLNLQVRCPPYEISVRYGGTHLRVPADLLTECPPPGIDPEDQ